MSAEFEEGNEFFQPMGKPASHGYNYLRQSNMVTRLEGKASHPGFTSLHKSYVNSGNTEKTIAALQTLSKMTAEEKKQMKAVGCDIPEEMSQWISETSQRMQEMHSRGTAASGQLHFIERVALSAFEPDVAKAAIEMDTSFRDHIMEAVAIQSAINEVTVDGMLPNATIEETGAQRERRVLRAIAEALRQANDPTTKLEFDIDDVIKIYDIAKQLLYERNAVDEE